MFEALDLDQCTPAPAAGQPEHVSTIRYKMPTFKVAAKNLVMKKVLEASHEQAKELVLQGEFARLLEEEKASVDWQALIHSLHPLPPSWSGG
jgi:Tfp pilus assembly protein PilF